MQTGTLPLEDGLDELEDIPEGEIRFRINKTVTFRTGRGLGDIMLENPKACEYDLEFSFSLQDGKIIYEAPLLKPGEYLYRDKLKKRLSRACTIVPIRCARTSRRAFSRAKPTGA